MKSSSLILLRRNGVQPRVCGHHAGTLHPAQWDGKIYVAGGWNSDYPEGMHLAEVYDPLTDKWEDLPPMPVHVKYWIGVAYKGKFHAISIDVDDQDRQQTIVFDPLSRSWHIKHEYWFSSADQVVVTDDQVYTINELDETVERRDAEKDERHIVGKLPPLFDPDYCQERKVRCCKLAALGHDLYLMGGTDISMKYSFHWDEDDLEQVRVCDTRCLPLIWRETRPMCLGTYGSIEAWATLKQQE